MKQDLRRPELKEDGTLDADKFIAELNDLKKKLDELRIKHHNQERTLINVDQTMEKTKSEYSLLVNKLQKQDEINVALENQNKKLQDVITEQIAKDIKKLNERLDSLDTQKPN